MFNICKIIDALVFFLTPEYPENNYPNNSFSIRWQPNTNQLLPYLNRLSNNYRLPLILAFQKCIHEYKNTIAHSPQ